MIGTSLTTWAFIGKVNEIRREQPGFAALYKSALSTVAARTRILWFNGKATPDGEKPYSDGGEPGPEQPQDTWVGLPIGNGVLPARSLTRCWICLQIRLITWQGEYNYVRLDPASQPAHIFLVTRNILPVENHRSRIREIDYPKMLDAVRPATELF